MTPSIGRIVHYTLSDQDALLINKRRDESFQAERARSLGNMARGGDVYPAMVVRVFAGGTEANGVCNLQVFLDGNDTFWATSRTEGEGEFCWTCRRACEPRAVAGCVHERLHDACINGQSGTIPALFRRRFRRNAVTCANAKRLPNRMCILFRYQPVTHNRVLWSTLMATAPRSELDFGVALRYLRAGSHITREGWNGRGMWLALQRPDEHSKMSRPYIYMSTVDGALVPWVASQSDLLANDWEVV
jgi:hypothetical protein